MFGTGNFSLEPRKAAPSQTNKVGRIEIQWQGYVGSKKVRKNEKKDTKHLNANEG